MLSKDNWIDNKTEEEAIKKLKTMDLKIGYPDWILNDTALEEFYEFVGDILPDTPFLEIQERVKDNIMLKQYQKLRQPNDKANTWLMPTTEINAYYQDTSNTIGFPAGILQSPFYSEGLPRALNYGGIGSTIAHEITHAFDDTGRHYDSTGNLRDWWTAHTTALFEKRAECFVKQYGSIYDEQTHMKLDGHLTLGENIADAGGVKGAFKAYKRQTKRVKERALPGLGVYTGDQLFFISFALSLCENMRTELLKDFIKYDAHSPPRYRVNTVLQNTEDFAAAFNCSKASKMVIDKKCVMW
ncbi:neprilysin-1 [Ixodes scapularis]